MTYDPSNYNLSSMDQLTQSEPTYLGAYGLTQAPFSSEQDDRFLYLNPSLNEQLELAKHYTQYGNLLLLITGERGIGKSSLKQRFINTAQEEWQICEIKSHTMMDASVLLRQIANGFGITEPPLDPGALYEVLSNQIEYIHQSSHIPILIIDDAHELPQDSLQSLLYLAEHHASQETALRIILFCEPEIEIMLDDPAIHSLKERVTHNMEIEPLDEAQTAEYLRHRLAVAGLDGTSPFTPKLVNKIFKASEGIPAKINEYAHQNLQDDSEPFVAESNVHQQEYIEHATPFNTRNIILSVFAITIVSTILYFQDDINNVFEEPNELVIADNTLANKENISIETTDAVEPSPVKDKIIEKIKEPIKEQIKEKTIEINIEQTPTTAETQDAQIQKEMPVLKAQASTATTTKSAAIQLLSVNPSPIPTSKQRQIISISGSGFHKRQKVKVSWTGKEKILADTQVNVTSDSYMNLILNTGMKADTWTITLIDTLRNIESNTISFDVVASNEKSIKPTKVAVKKKEIKKEKVFHVKKQELELQNGLYGQNWIKQQNKNHFTLQLLATHTKSTLPDYVNKFTLTNVAATFKTHRNGKDWFTLVYGKYATKSAAQAAAQKLPKGMSKPWIRSFASILPTLSQQQKAKPVVAVNTTPKIVGDNQEGWLWSQDPSHYTLQLAAGTDKKAIQSFIKRHKLRGKAVYFHRLRDGKDWYILVHGSYAGYSKAKQAIKQLPTAVQNAKPWTRTFGAIHTELN